MMLRTQSSLQKNQTLTVQIQGLSHDGRGITMINGMTTFVEGALPNETVICEIVKKHRQYLEAKTLEIIVSAPERTEPKCPHFGVCGGCSMQHIQVDHQIQFKQQALLEQLQRFGKVSPKEIGPPLIGSAWGYRRRARLGVKFVKKKGRVFVGFREKMSSFLTELKTCSVLHPSIGNRLTDLSTLIQSLSQYDHIPQIEVAVSDTDSALVFRHMTDLPTADLNKLSAFGEKFNFHIYLQPNQPAAITKLWPKDSQELLFYALPDYKLNIQFHPLDFVQINGEINQRLINLALIYLAPQPTDSILDLFCGLGNFTLPLARYAKHVTGIEGAKEMVMRAEENAKNNKIENTYFYAANLMEPSKNAPWLLKKYDKILLDPPRTGAKEIIPFLANLSAKQIVYVSCNPATLARDAGELVSNLGYKLKKVAVINMFPHTNHIEAIALFEK